MAIQLNIVVWGGHNKLKWGGVREKYIGGGSSLERGGGEVFFFTMLKIVVLYILLLAIVASISRPNVFASTPTPDNTKIAL